MKEIFCISHLGKKNATCAFLARRDNCPESYCHDPGVGVGGGVGVTPQGKNFNLGYIF
jgi:hypothetical protein